MHNMSRKCYKAQKHSNALHDQELREQTRMSKKVKVEDVKSDTFETSGYSNLPKQLNKNEGCQNIESNTLPGEGESSECSSLIIGRVNADKYSFDTSLVNVETSDKNVAEKRRKHCKKCEFITKNRKEYLYHLKDIHRKKFTVHECKNCFYASRRAQKVERHSNALHKQLNELKCNLCSFVPHSEAFLNIHNDIYHKKIKQENESEQDISTDNLQKCKNTESSSTLLRCKFCSFKTEFKQNLHTHLKDVHRFCDSVIEVMIKEALDNVTNTRSKNESEGFQDIENETLSSSTEDNPFNASSLINIEMDDKELPPTARKRQYHCIKCVFLTRNPREYLYHLKDIHKEKFNIYKCKYCLYASKDIRKVQRHSKALHKREVRKEAKMSKKVKTKSEKSNSNAHKQLKKNEGKFKCNLCSFVAISRELLDSHTYSYHIIDMEHKIKKENVSVHIDSKEGSLLKSQNAEFCSTLLNKDIQNKSHLNSEIESEEQVDEAISKEPAVISLEDCFSEMSSNPLKACHICGKGFKYAAWLIKHLKIHFPKLNIAAATSKFKQKHKAQVKSSKQDNTINKKQKEKNSIMLSSGQEKSIIANISERETIFKCDKCDEKFKWKKFLLCHIQKCHDSERITSEFNFKPAVVNDDKVACGGASSSYDNFELPIHSTVEGPDPKIRSINYTVLGNTKNVSDTRSYVKKYFCPNCDYSTKSISCFHVHMTQHSKEEQFKCSECDFSSKWRYKALEHKFSKLCTEASTIETNCPVFDSERYKKYLLNSCEPLSVTSQVNATQQENRSIKFSLKNPNSDSVEIEMPFNRYFYCNHCDFKHAAKKIVVSHLASHKNIKQFICNSCGLESSWRHVLVKHAKTVHGGNLKAIEDRINFIQEGSVLTLAEFLNKEAIKKSKPTLIYSCSICKYTCYSRYFFEAHERLHVNPSGTNLRSPDFIKTKPCFRKNVKYQKTSCSSFNSNAKDQECKINETNCNSMSSTESLNHANQRSPDELFQPEIKSGNEVSSSKEVSVYNCLKCPAVFKTVKGLTKHENFHGSRLPLKCTFCDFGAKYTAQLTKHLTVHSAEYKSKHKSSLHSANSCSHLSVEDHLGKTSGSNLKENNKILSKREVSELKATLKNKSNLLKCSYCPSSFFETSVLKYHESLHGSNGKFKCKHCNYAVNESKKLKIHYSVHSIKKYSKSFSCHKCPTVLYHQSRYERHLELHGKNLKFMCDQCDFSVQNAVNLLRHKKIHAINHEPEASENWNLTVKNEPVEEPTPDTNEKTIYICDRCPFHHVQKDVMQSHQRHHWFKDCLKCDHCDYSCKQQSCLQSHLNLHLKKSSLLVPHAFMKFESFKIYAKDENDKTLLFDDQIMLSHKTEIPVKAKVTSSCESDVKNDSDFNSSLSFSKIPVVVLSDIFATSDVQETITK